MTPHELIRASAGSGKTYQLTSRYLELLAANVPADRILATTFTRKAAGEILGRVLLRLAKGGGDPQTLRALVAKLHRLRIGTIDSFFAKLATSFALELDLPPRWRIATKDEDGRLRAAALSATLGEDPTRVTELVRALGGGAGRRSIAEDLANQVRQLYELFLDSPRDAWSAPDLAPALAAPWTEHDRLAAAAELESFAEASTTKPLAKTLREIAGRLRTDRLDCLVETTIVVNVLGGATKYAGSLLPEAVRDAVERVGVRVRDHVRVRLADQTAAAWALLSSYDRHYRVEKTRTGLLCFEDVTRALARASLLERLDDVYFRLDGEIHHVLLDEFQDTSLAQWQVLLPLAENAAADATGEHGLLVVGDEKQAIYGWRGGDAEIFRRLGSVLPGLTERRLAESRRSSPAVIDTVNRVFGAVASIDAVQQASAAGARTWAQGFVPHGTVVTARGYARLVVAPATEDGESQLDVTLRHAAERVKALHEAAPQATIGVLTRTNAALAKLVYYLRQRDVPVSEEGGGALVDSPAVTPITSLLTLADHPEDGVARWHVARSPLGEHVGLRDARNLATGRAVAREWRARLAAEGYAGPIAELAEVMAKHSGERDARRLAQLCELATRWAPLATLRPSDFVAHVRHERIDDPSSAQVRVMTVHGSKGLEQDIVVLPELEVELVEKNPSWLVERDPVTRRPTRIVAPAKKGERAMLSELLGDLRAEIEAGDVEESLSLLYVAITRARHGLEMIVAPTEKAPGKTWAGILRATLSDGGGAAPGAVLHEHGDLGTLDDFAGEASAGLPARSPAAGAAAPPPPAPAVTLTTPAIRRRALPRTSPSGLEGTQKSGLVDVAAMLRLGEDARRRGTVLHAMLERIEWLDDGVPPDTELAGIARAHGATEAEATALTAELRAIVAHPQIAAALSRGSRETAGVRAEVRRELPFAVREGDGILTGSVDRLVVLRDASGAVLRAEVSDFKTDRLADDAAIRERVAHYRPQLAAYASAVAKMLRIDIARVSAKLLFVTPGVAAGV